MRVDCEVIRDLLPLYVENIASEKSRALVEEHCADCVSCRDLMSSMEEMDMEIEHTGNELKTFKKEYNKHIITMIAFAIYCTLAMTAFVEGRFLMDESEAMGYGILYFFLILPLGALICNALLGTQKNKIKFVAPFIFGIVGLVLPWAVSSSTEKPVLRDNVSKSSAVVPAL